MQKKPLWIENVSYIGVRRGEHRKPIKAILIQIVDPCMEFPKPYYEFKEVYQFEFLDAEEGDKCEEFHITDEQAQSLVSILKRAQEQETDVVVHCVAGLCRSGAVAEVGIMMGFEDTRAIRIPNLQVKKKMMKVLGWTYD
jgi:predicted protein tyrosine phosphatase